MNSSLGHLPGSRWEFDESVTSVFDDMLARSIPQIQSMRASVNQVASSFIRPGTDILDLGCALGEAMAPLVKRFGATSRFLGIEISDPMLEACRARFSEEIADGRVEIRADDLCRGYPGVEASVTLCVLSLMFTPVESRYRILADAFRHTISSGALILVEKVLGADGTMEGLLTELYHDHKRGMGYSNEEIDRKRLALQGVLVPLTAGWNEQLLRNAGFQHVECFWRCLNFCGWLAIKE